MDALDVKGNAFVSTLTLPCDSTKFGDKVYAAFVKKNFNGSAAVHLGTYNDMMSLMCGALGGEAYLGVVLFLEIITLILCLMFGVRVFNHPVKFSAFLFCSACLWGVWPVILTIRYHDVHTKAFTCYIPYSYVGVVCLSSPTLLGVFNTLRCSSLTVAVFSIWFYSSKLG
jgi:hypothetical protein